MIYDPSLPRGYLRGELTVQQCLDNGGHCFVRDGIAYATYPQQYPEHCKHCPARRVATPRDAWDYRDTTPKEHLT